MQKVEHKTSQEDIPPDETVVPVTTNLQPIGKFPRRKIIVSTSLVITGFASAFIVQKILDNPVIPPLPVASPTPLSTSILPVIKVIKFAILPTLDFKTLAEQENWNNFIKDMEKKLGISVNILPVQSYKEVIEAINNNDAQIAWFGGQSYIEAAKKNQIEAFAQTVNNDGSRGYYSYLITNKNQSIVSQLKSLDKNQSDKYIIDGIKNGLLLTFAFNDKNSTSGFLIPNLCVFAKNGIEPETVLTNPPSFLRSHEATALAVADERVDIATNNSEALARLQKSHPQAYEKIEVLWESRIIPSDPIAYRKDLPENIKKNIQDFFYNYQNQTVLNIMGWSGFEQASSSNWDIIRDFDNITNKIKSGASNSQLQAEAQSICSP
ncbi:phosphate/phosphite/phosphonate ABC transporter substrate-binding protein [Plectonema radiosum]|uniref:phosphate/phosphite/phosphonate ABC transporter substrate-binding protein n=1 Tax=Plectonema radiosum TaxID=945768 RepID=UPI001D14B38B|nr:phosphate/phosphite/phosphonate ABC transporter substrate-binding protein [Plectonema radiosum]